MIWVPDQHVLRELGSITSVRPFLGPFACNSSKEAPQLSSTSTSGERERLSLDCPALPFVVMRSNARACVRIIPHCMLHVFTAERLRQLCR
jgi:hypothetical protein